MDRQHYCTYCKQWFHQECLGDPIEPDEDDEPTQSHNFHIDKLLNGVPICRGSYGVENCLADWHVVGTGRQLKKVKEWIRDGNLPGDWKTRLGLDFVKDMLETGWLFFQCPSCDSTI